MTTVDQNRQKRLVLLEEKFGSQVALSERIGKSPAQISQWKNAARYTGSEKKRAMGRATARHIEKILDLPEGWMDQPVTEVGAKSDLSAGTVVISEIEAELLRYFRAANEVGRGQIRDIARGLSVIHPVGAAAVGEN